MFQNWTSQMVLKGWPKNFAIDQANNMRYQVPTILEKPKQKEKINMTARKFVIG